MREEQSSRESCPRRSLEGLLSTFFRFWYSIKNISDCVHPRAPAVITKYQKRNSVRSWIVYIPTLKFRWKDSTRSAMPQEQAPGVISQPQRADAVRIAQQDVYIMD